MFGNFDHIHFIGIGGIGMSGIAELMLYRGYTISGSDRQLTPITERLSRLGVTIFQGHREENVIGARLVVYSSAVDPANPELVKAKKDGIVAIKRAEMLAECMRGKYGVGIAGTHGKTSTTAMTALSLMEAGMEPSVLVGGVLKELGGANVRAGKGDFIVVEADEFDRTFLKLTPAIAVINNIEADHLDTYRDIDDIRQAFVQFANSVPFFGFTAICSDDPNAFAVSGSIHSRKVFFGLTRDADYYGYNIRQTGTKTEFSIDGKHGYIGEVSLSVPGIHNVRNALAALTVSAEIGIPFRTAVNALKQFTGAGRRFEIKYEGDVTVIDDYAHHPTEVLMTLKALKSGWNRRIVAVFQPHLFSRTRDFFQEFGDALKIADCVVVTDVYPAREEAIPGVTGDMIAEAVRKSGHTDVHYVQNKSELPEYLLRLKRSDDIIVTMGAGDIVHYGELLVSELMKSGNRE